MRIGHSITKIIFSIDLAQQFRLLANLNKIKNISIVIFMSFSSGNKACLVLVRLAPFTEQCLATSAKIIGVCFTRKYYFSFSTKFHIQCIVTCLSFTSASENCIYTTSFSVYLLDHGALQSVNYHNVSTASDLNRLLMRLIHGRTLAQNQSHMPISRFKPNQYVL